MTIIDIIYILLTILIYKIFVISVQNHSSKISNFFILMMLVQLFISVGTMSLLPIENATVVEWFTSNKIKNLAIGFLPAIWLMFIYEYLGIKMKWRVSIVLGILSLIFFSITLILRMDDFILNFFNKLLSYSMVSLLVNTPKYELIFLLIALIISAQTLLIYIKNLSKTGAVFKSSIVWITILLTFIYLSQYFIVTQVLLGIDLTFIASALISVFLYRLILDNDIKNIIPVTNNKILDDLPIPVLIIDENKIILYANNQAYEEIPYLDIGYKLFKIKSIVDINKNDNILDSDYITIFNKDIDEKSTYILKSNTFENTNYTSIMLQEVTDDKKNLERLYNQSMIDNLTGLLNKNTFKKISENRISEYKALGSSYAFFMLDLDFFKKINDKYGHQAGDDVLIALASDLQRLTSTESLISRFGGEEFCGLLPFEDEKSLLLMLETIKNSFNARKFIASGHSFYVTLSIGYVIDSKNIYSLAQLMDYADNALYQAKSAGRNSIIKYE